MSVVLGPVTVDIVAIVRTEQNMHQINKSVAHKLRPCEDQRPSGLVLLAIGDPRRLPEDVTDTDEALEGVHFLAIDQLSRDAIELIAPDVVLSPLVSSGFDCLDIAERLDRVGFVGRYRIVVDQLPRPDLIRREIKSAFPALDCDVLMLDRPRLQIIN